MDGYHLKYSGEKVEEAIELALTEPDRTDRKIQNSVEALSKDINQEFYKTQGKLNDSDLRYYYGTDDITPTPESYFYYSDNGNGTCAITGVTQEGLDAQPTAIVIPYEISGLKVVEIRNDGIDGFNTYSTFTKAESIIIPLSVTKIGEHAFSYTCISDINIPDSVTEINGTPFYGCSIKSVKLSDNLKILSNGLFYGCNTNDLETLYVPDSVEAIDNSSTGYCILGVAKYVSVPHHILEVHSSPSDVFGIICEIRGGETFKVNSAPCFGNATNVRIIFPKTCKTIDGYVCMSAKNCVIEIPSNVVGISGLIDGDNSNTIVCEQGSFADYWAKNMGFDVRYDIVGISSIESLISEKVTPLVDAAVADGLSNKADKSTTLAGYGITDSYTISQIDGILADAQSTFELKTRTESYEWATHICNFSECYNVDIRLTEILKSLSINIPNEVYEKDYTSGLSFNSGENPTSVNYTGTGILNWVGTDCSVSEGYSIFQPSPNTHYDIVFYYNGIQFVGLVNGFVPAIGNKAANVSGNEVA